jgi:hypothetical protein
MVKDNAVLEIDGRNRVHYKGLVIFADVYETSAIAVETRGKFSDLLMVNAGKYLKPNWDIDDIKPGIIVPDRKIRIVGGLHYVGIRPLHDVKHYKSRWKTSRMEEKVGVFKLYEKELWYVNLKPSILYMEVEQAETSPSLIAGKQLPERIPVDVELLYNCIVVNPFNVLYKAPGYWIEKAEELISAVIAGWIGTKTLDELYSVRQKSPRQLWEEIKDDPLFTMLRDEWGWLITDVRMKSVTPPKNIQEAGMKQAQTVMETDADLQETSVKWLKMVADRTGLTVQEISSKLKDNYKQFRKDYGDVADECWKMILLKTELKSNARFHFESEGASGPEGWIALLGAMGAFGNKGGGNNQKGDVKGKNKSSSQNLKDRWKHFKEGNRDEEED